MPVDVVTTIGIAASIFFAVVTSRTTGMGFAMVASPFLVLTLGPFEGILVVNAFAAVSAAVNARAARAQIEWNKTRQLLPFALIGIVPGAIAARLLPSGPLAVVVALLILLGLLATVFGIRSAHVRDGVSVRGAAGFTSGFMAATSGVGGPALAVYAIATGWEHRRFAATAQIQYLAMGIAALLAKWSVPDLAPEQWLTALVSVLAGAFVGNRIAPRIDPAVGMRVVIVVATLGATVTLLRGLGVF